MLHLHSQTQSAHTELYKTLKKIGGKSNTDELKLKSKKFKSWWCKAVKSVSRSLVYLKTTLYWTYGVPCHMIGLYPYPYSKQVLSCLHVEESFYQYQMSLLCQYQVILIVLVVDNIFICLRHLAIFCRETDKCWSGIPAQNQEHHGKFPTYFSQILSNPKQEKKMQYNAFGHFSDHLPIRLDR